MLTPEQQQTLLRVARKAITAVVEHRSCHPECHDPVLQQPAAAFVTLHRHGELRGCIGTVNATTPLVETIVEMAQAAATQDYRFTPVTAREVPELRIEISVLTPPEPVIDISEIEIGVHGLIIEQGYRRGLLLPQVPTEWGWDREEFLQHTCLKASLPRDAWKRGATIQKFSAEVSGEEEEKLIP